MLTQLKRSIKVKVIYLIASTEVPELKKKRQIIPCSRPNYKKTPLVEHLMALKQLCFNNYARLCRFLRANNNKANIV